MFFYACIVKLNVEPLVILHVLAFWYLRLVICRGA